MKSIYFILVLWATPPRPFLVHSPAALRLIQADSRSPVPPRTVATDNRCSAQQFTPNYAAEVGIFQSVRWEHFPLAIWIDSSNVENSEEMSELRAGLSKWSDATGGVLGVTFVEKQDRAQILVKMVDKLPGANGRTNFVPTEHGMARLVSIEIVHSHWAGAPPVQKKPGQSKKMQPMKWGTRSASWGIRLNAGRSCFVLPCRTLQAAWM